MSSPESLDTPAGPAKLRRTTRKTLAISVMPDGSLELVAPEGAPLAAILAKIEKRLRWIRTQQSKFETMNTARPVLRYVNGSTHRYLGRQYRLKILRTEETFVSLRGAFFHVGVPEISDEIIKRTLDRWFRNRAREQFSNRLEAWKDWCRHRGLPEPRLGLRKMAKRWGSALPNGTILLNPELIHAPSACVDYVITHEICHLRHPDHSSRFWGLLKQLMPDWETLKARLERAN